VVLLFSISRERRRSTCAFVLALALSSVASAISYKQPGFSERVVFSGLVNPTVVRFLPDGRVLVAEKSGLIKMFDSLTDPSATVVADLRTNVHNFWDRGLLGLAVPPGFDPLSADDWRRHIYVLYTHDAFIGGTAPKWGVVDGTSDPCPSSPAGPGPTTDGCVVSGRLSKLLATGADWADNEDVLLEDWCQQFPSHSTGALDFGADEKLYVSGGDGASFTNSDWGQFGGTVLDPGNPGTFFTPANPCGDPPFPIGTPQTKPTAEGGALRSQSPRRAPGEARLLNGAILRVDPATGDPLPDNPLFSSTDVNEQRTIGYGLRNPFRMILRPGTNDVFIADVGWSTWEELNRIPDLSVARNFGWPCFEGNAAQYTGLNICPAQGLTTAPLFAYNHGSPAVPDDGCTTGGSSVAGMAFYQGDSNYPGGYQDALFFSDYSRKCMWVMFPGGGGDPDPATRAAFASTVSNGPVDLQIGPDGNLYYVGFDAGTVVRVVFGLAAVAEATSPTAGPLPLNVSFDGSGSQVATPGDTLTYEWDLDGDGDFDDSTAVQPSFNYTLVGDFEVRLRVTDNHGGFSVTDPIVVHAGNEPPTATVLTPAASLTWQVGDTISFSGSAEDPETGTLPSSALFWEILIQHCPTVCHTHVYQTFSGVAAGSFPAPDHEYPSYLEIRLTATDPVGLTHATSVAIQPQTVDLSFHSNPTGLQLTSGTVTAAAPFTRTVIVNSQVALEAPDQGPYSFVSWSNGGDQSHTIAAPASPVTYLATFTSGGPLPPPWVNQDVGAVAEAGSATFESGAFMVNGAGIDIDVENDEFHFVSQPFDGDGSIVARVVSQQNTNEWAKAGVMIRESMVADAPNALMATTPEQGVTFQRRLVAGGTTLHTPGLPAAAPYWVKMVRSGSTFSAFSSPDGAVWTPVGSDTIAMSDDAHFGMAVSSHHDGILSTAVFDNVQVNHAPIPEIATPAASLTWAVGDTIDFSGAGEDTEDGTLAESALSWTVLHHYCPSTCTTEVVGTFAGVDGGSFVAPAAQHPSTLEIQLTATDSEGLTKTTSVTIAAQTVALTFATSPAGLDLTVAGTTAAAPIVRTAIVGSTTAVDAPSPQGAFPTVWSFVSWSDAGAQSHTVTAPAANTTYTATYVANADLAIALGDAPDPVSAGANLTYTLTVSNAGPSQATAISVAHTLPAGVALVSAGGTGWSCAGTGPVTCTLASLGLGAAAPISVVVTAPNEPESLASSATVSASSADPVSGNDTAAATTTVVASADLSVTQLAAPSAVCPGGAATFTLNVSNAGPSAATTVSVTSTIPAGATLVSASGTGWSCSGTATVTCTRASLASGATAPIAIAITAPDTPGTATNNAAVSAATADPASANNSASASVTVNPTPPAPTAGNGGAVCVGETLQLTASAVAGATYAWTGPNGFVSALQNPTIPNATLAAAGLYSVTVTLDGCTSAPATTTAEVNPLPTAVVSGDAAICEGDSTEISAALTGTGPWSLTWSDGFVQNVGVSPATRTVSPVDTTIYTVTSVSDAHCAGAGSGQAEVEVGDPVATPTLTAPVSAAVGATGLAASVADHPGATYAWALSGGTITSGQGTSAITFDAGAPGTTMALSVTETSGACTSAAAAQAIQVDFLDVPPPHIFHDFVNTIARNGVTAGCGSGNFCPEAPNTRAQMAVFLLKSKFGADHVPPDPVGIFDDVPVDNPFAPWIEEIAALQITAGCGGANYCPNAPVTRSQMAVFLLKALLGFDYVPPLQTGTLFGDVPSEYFAAAYIEDLYNRGITGGCQSSPLLYCPATSVTRGQMSVFLTRTFSLE
jgi:uncharacterized repeat protein (TIGR01451 family)